MFVGFAAAWPMGGGSDDSDETWSNQSRQSLCKHCARRRQPDDLTSPRLTVTFSSKIKFINDKFWTGNTFLKGRGGIWITSTLQGIIFNECILWSFSQNVFPNEKANSDLKHNTWHVDFFHNEAKVPLFLNHTACMSDQKLWLILLRL